MANGQPEESLTCHQPMSMPTSPTRGRTCQTPQPLSPSSRRLIRTWRWSARLEQHPLEPQARVLAAALALLEQRPGLGDAVGERVAQPLELAEAEDARAAQRRDGGVDPAVGHRVHDGAGQAMLEPA